MKISGKLLTVILFSVALIIVSLSGTLYAVYVNTGLGVITGVATPIANTDAANKAYVDAAVSGSSSGFLGLSSYTVYGDGDNAGVTSRGIFGMDKACADTFAGSHACTYSEVEKYAYHMNSTSYNGAWVVDAMDSFYVGGNLAWVKGGATSGQGTTDNRGGNCNAWTSVASSSYYGAILSTTANSVTFSQTTCEVARNVICCS